MDVTFADLLGKTLLDVKVMKDDDQDNSIVFICTEGGTYRMFHSQDCCESVVIEDITGDVSDLVGAPILLAEEAISKDDESTPEGYAFGWARSMGAFDGDESNTWTFYKLSTIKGSVTIRWHGSSNGYYSESVSFYKVD